MRIVIGESPAVGRPGTVEVNKSGGVLEARILDIRPPRRREGKHPAGEERRKDNRGPDPANGCVLVLLTPDGHKLPPDLASGKYRVFVRFMPR